MDSRKLTGLLLCAPGISVIAAEPAILAGQPNTVSRTVTYHRTDVVPIATEIRYTTLIALPKEESIMQVTCGDKDYWPVNWSGNLAYIKPAKPGSETNVNLITASGNVYSFLVSEVSQQAGAHADLKVFVTPADRSAIERGEQLMSEQATPIGSQSQPIPNPDHLLPAGALSNKHKRWIFFGVMCVVLVIIFANLIGSNAPHPSKPPAQKTTAQQQNPTPAQIRDWENNLQQAEAELQQETNQAKQQLGQSGGMQNQQARQTPITTDDLERAAALQDSRNAIALQGGNVPPQKSQIETEKEQLAYKSLFADNLVKQESIAQPAMDRPATTPAPVPAVIPQPAGKPESGESRKALDFDPAAQQDYWLPEGTVMEPVLTNRLDGDSAGPVNCMITSLLLIPQGARVLGEASKVSSFGQQRLSVVFHRVIVPAMHAYAIPLDQKPSALAQAGEAGLQGKVKSHYFSLFGSSLAVGAISGLAQIDNGYSGFVYDPSIPFRNGVTESMAESSNRILDRFLNRMPTITIPEGTRVKIVLTGDLQLPAYDSMHTNSGGL